uniref:Ovule protein n=1 Tax=Caenorhabditis tropicalis TaxID=1561998 RepID=A0A1I7TTH2_9PELO
MRGCLILRNHARGRLENIYLRLWARVESAVHRSTEESNMVSVRLQDTQNSLLIMEIIFFKTLSNGVCNDGIEEKKCQEWEKNHDEVGHPEGIDLK